MSLDNIVKKILDEAQKTAVAVSNGADKELDRFRAELSSEEKEAEREGIEGE